MSNFRALKCVGRKIGQHGYVKSISYVDDFGNNTQEQLDEFISLYAYPF